MSEYHRAALSRCESSAEISAEEHHNPIPASRRSVLRAHRPLRMVASNGTSKPNASGDWEDDGDEGGGGDSSRGVDNFRRAGKQEEEGGEHGVARSTAVEIRLEIQEPAI